MIDESVTKDAPAPRSTPTRTTDLASGPTPGPREAKRLATRQSILDATVDGLVEDGYGSLTTRRIAERAGIAQSTLMHHFETREALLVEAVSALAESMAETAVAEIQQADLPGGLHREAVLDQAWATFTTPQALAAAEMLGAAWSEPELAESLRQLELKIAELVLTTAFTLFPDESSEPRFAVYIDGVFQLIRGLITSIPTWGRETVEARWTAIKPVVVDAAEALIPPRG